MGNRDGDGPAAYRYCVSEETLIITNKGTMPISQLIDYADGENLIDIQIKDFKGDFVPATKIFNCGSHPTKKIVLSNGMELIATYNHPLMVLNNECDFCWKTIETINLQDKILIPHFQTQTPKTFDKKNGSLEAKMLGCMISEGYITTQNRFGINNKDIDMIQPVYDFVQNSISSKAKINYNKTRQYYEYCVANKDFYNSFTKRYGYACQAKDKTIPSQIWTGTLEDKAAFLSYLFEGDGSIVNQDESYKISYSTRSKNLAKQIQILLLQDFNIFSSINHAKTGEYQLVISSIGILRFKDWIGFISERKNNKLNDACKSISFRQKCPSNSYYNVTEVSEYIRKLNSNHFTTKHNMSNPFTIGLSKDYIDPINFERLQNLVNNYLYIPIKSIEDSGDQNVYSVRVDNIESDHSYIANGFINHNTESRLGTIVEDGMLKGINKNAVDFIPNFDETCQEPVELPALFPNLLCNPNAGIGVAMACNWAPHNLREVAQAIYDYIDNKEPMLPGPDFPTGGIIMNKNDIPNIMRTGHGSVKIRGKYIVENNSIIFTEIPYGVATENLMKQIGEAADEGRLPGVKDIRNESDRKHGFRLNIECDKSASIATIVKLLFKETDLQSSFSYNQVALVDKTPTELNLKDCIKIYISHNEKCISREAQFNRDKCSNKLEIVEGLLKALEDIDNIIALIKGSESAAAAVKNLIAKYKFTDSQARAIVDMKLGKLAGLEKIEIQNEKKDLLAQIAELDAILADPKKELRTRLEALVAKYGDDRRTELAQIADDTKEDKETAYVEPEKCVVILTESGNIKRIPLTSFKTQKSRGKGVKTQDDITAAVIRTNTVDALMVFTNKGKMYRLIVDSVPSGTNTTKGVPVSSLVEMDPGEKVSTIYSIYKDTDAKYVFFSTKNGIVKKTPLEEYEKTKKKTGLIAINVKDGDELVSVTLVKDETIILLSKNGQALRFNSTDINATARTTAGVKGIALAEGDEVVAALPVRDTNDNFGIFISGGYGKSIELKDLPIQARGGKGLLICKLPKGNSISSGALINDTDNLLLVGTLNSICISAADVPVLGRSALGNILIKGNIKSVSKV